MIHVHNFWRYGENVFNTYIQHPAQTFQNKISMFVYRAADIKVLSLFIQKSVLYCYVYKIKNH